MQSDLIRSTFLQYFQEKGHKLLPSFPLLPAGDPSLLLINAGMAPLKPYFLGEQEPLAPRITTCQKCVRVIDIDKVGTTARHLTFFEMLGNFSFGDYFKKEAILFAVEFLTGRLGLPLDKISATIYQKDEEACSIWKEEVGLPPERILRRGEEENFWMAGKSGPCGPDSELFFDRGRSLGCGQKSCAPGCDCDRFVEIWNLVFMQYNRAEDGTLTPLPRKNIDTGMGLERLAMLLQDKPTVFETDLFAPLLNYFRELGRESKREGDPEALRLIADHARAAVHLIADGLLPSNEGRGYVLRRILRKAILTAKRTGLPPLLARSVPLVAAMVQKSYPELKEREETILGAVREEEEHFLRTLDQGEKLFFETLSTLPKEKKLPGKVAFKLYDTYGFPLELTVDLLKKEGRELDEKGFQKEMQQQKERSKQRAAENSWKGIDRELPEVSFVGYQQIETKAELLLLFQKGERVKSLGPGEKGEVVLSPTPFYAEAGGQVGDRGTLQSETAEASVLDCQKEGKSALVKVKVHRGTLTLGSTIEARVDPMWRQEAARHHTATHLLHSALRRVLGKQVRQAGSLVHPNFLRFDYTFYRPPTKEELLTVEETIHQWILQDLPVKWAIMDYESSQKVGALAFFGEKYGAEVRVIQIADVSTELCGGTHLQRTLEVGFFKILREEGIGAGVRRIEAVCGKRGFALGLSQCNLTRELSRLLHCREEELNERVHAMLEQNLKEKKKNELLSRKLLAQKASSLHQHTVEVAGLCVLSYAFKADEEEKEGRMLLEELKKKGELDMALIIQERAEKKATVGLYVGPRARKAGFRAKELLTALTSGGGGRDEVAYGALPGGESAQKVQAKFSQEVEKRLLKEGSFG